MNLKRINIVGVGSLGSYQAFLLTTMSRTLECEIKVLDFDQVELHNTANQLYRSSDVGRPKVEALKEIVDPLTEGTILIENTKVTRDTDLRDILIIMVDSMAVRKDIFETFQYDSRISYYIEARTGGNLAMIYAFNPRNQHCIDCYQKTLYNDNEVVNPICAIAETVPTLWTVSSAVANILVLLKNNKISRDQFIEVAIDLSDLPFMKSSTSENG